MNCKRSRPDCFEASREKLNEQERSLFFITLIGDHYNRVKNRNEIVVQLF